MDRLDLAAIKSLIPEGARVLDLGCGDGLLLAQLVAEKKIVARGVEIDETKVRACISRGLTVRQGNIEEGLADFRDGAFDYVVLSQTLAYLNKPEPVVREMLRVGTRAIVSFDNAGYWRARLRAFRGRGMGADINTGEPRERAITFAQFERFVHAMGARVERRVSINRTGITSRVSVLRARVAVFLVSR
jgi:methionine biosynthesis protein MetW